MKKSLAGTGRLIRLALRRDRIKLPVWILSITGLAAVGPPAIKEVYGSQEALVEYAATTSSSMVARLLAGPIDAPNLGSVLMVEYYAFFAVLIAFMSTLAVVRHTRQNEETGRSELVGSTIVGRHAALSAALIVAIGANLVLGAAIASLFAANRLPTDGSWAMGASLAGIGIVFAAIAAITAQMFQSARASNSLAGAVIGVSFLVRGIGDAMGTVATDGLSVASAWPTWFSPIGWGQQMHPFAEITWRPLILVVVAAVALSGLAFYLTAHRDVGLGIFADRRGPAAASPKLLTPLGLAWRLQKGTLRGWAIGTFVMGLTLGVTAIEFKDLFTENPEFAEAISQLGGGADGSFTDIYFAGMMAFMGILFAGYALQAFLRTRAEEASGRFEQVLAGSVSRHRLLFSHLTCVLGGLVALALLAGLSTGISYVITAGNGQWQEVLSVTAAAFVQVPAVLVLVGLGAVLFGWLPRLSVALTWSVYVVVLLLMQFGALLKLPDWTLKLSPFYHLPAAPAETVAVRPILVLSAIALLLVSLGFISFRRRDLTLE